LFEKNNIHLTHRLATGEDIPQIMALMEASIVGNMKAYLSDKEIEFAKTTMGVDHSLIDDQTYYIIETPVDDKKIMVGCGGWGKRKTLYGGDHTQGRDDSLSNPASEPARIRAMYTHPIWIRKGVGRYLVELGERKAKQAGFKHIELGATISGEDFYLSLGYKEIDRDVQINQQGVENLIVKMSKPLF